MKNDTNSKKPNMYSAYESMSSSMKQHQPEVHDRARRLFQCSTFILGLDTLQHLLKKDKQIAKCETSLFCRPQSASLLISSHMFSSLDSEIKRKVMKVHL